MAKFKETYASELPPVSDGVIRGAKLLGLTSRNGRRYEGKGLESAKGLYEGRKVFINHDREGVERDWSDWAGVIENVKYQKGKGLFGDVVLRQESSHFKGIVEVANSPKFRKSCGFSHVAEGESHFDGDCEIIESIVDVHSVDLVCDPATTAGIFESVRTLTEVSESSTATLAECSTKLTEMMDAGFMGSDFSLGGGAGEDTTPTDPMGQVISILKTAIAAIADMGKAVAKANQKPDPAPIVPGEPKEGAFGKKPGEKKPGESDEESEDEDMTPEDKEKIAAFESLQRENAELKASKLLLESGREATDIRMKALANCATDDEQTELLESWPRIEESSRPSRSAPLVESADEFDFSQPGSFAARYR